MTISPVRYQQIVQSHATMIVAVATAAQQGVLPPELAQGFQVSEENGWTDLIRTLRKVIAGDRSQGLLAPLDEEDRVIVQAVLTGIQNPSTLPDPNAQADASMAAPGLAGMIHAASTGQAEALQLLAGMSEQMSQAGGDMARLGGIMRRLVNGERDADVLSKGMGAQGISLLTSILDELAKLELH